MQCKTYGKHLVGALAMVGVLSASAAPGEQELSASRVQAAIDQVEQSRGAISERVAGQPDSKETRKARSLLEHADVQLAKAKQSLESGDLKRAQNYSAKAQTDADRASESLEGKSRGHQ